MEKKKISIVYKMNKKDIMHFVSTLHTVQLEMIEQAVEKSDYKDAKEVLKYIMEKK